MVTDWLGKKRSRIVADDAVLLRWTIVALPGAVPVQRAERKAWIANFEMGVEPLHFP